MSATNVDPAANFTNLRKRLPKTQNFITRAAQNFEFNIRRYDTLIGAAPPVLAAGAKRPAGAPTEREQHMYQAAIVLGVGAFDAYIRQFTIDAYLHLMFTGTAGSLRMPPRVLQKWNEAVRSAVQEDPSILVRVAALAPDDAKLELATNVFDVQSVRLMTGDFKAANLSLESAGVSLEPRAGPQLLRVAPDIFDAYATARHLFVHVGTSASSSLAKSGRPGSAYCANDEPARFLGAFLRGLVTIVEERWQVLLTTASAPATTRAPRGRARIP